jgi:hypothetical protein
MRALVVLAALVLSSFQASPSLAIAFNPNPCYGTGIFGCLPINAPKPKPAKPKPKPKPAPNVAS